MIDSTISGNRAYGSGGGLEGETIHVANSVISQNRNGFEHFGGGLQALHVTVENSTIAFNFAPGGGGGGIVAGDVRVVGSVIRDNRASYGGGGIRSDGDIYVADSLVSGNDGGYYNGEGGGIRGGAVTVVRSTVSDNIGSSYGGGIYSSSSAHLENTTVSGNTVFPDVSANGGGVFSRGDVTLVHSTVSGNLVDSGEYSGGGGGILAETVALDNSIVLGNATGTAADEIQGAIVLTGGNILGPNILDGETDVGDVTAAEVFSATTEIAPGVLAGALADNGGPTPTIAIRADGPAAGPLTRRPPWPRTSAASRGTTPPTSGPSRLGRRAG